VRHVDQAHRAQTRGHAHPHWHANANELTYCVSGTSLVSVLDTDSRFASFTVAEGEMFHIDSGSLHHIENIDDEPADFILAFRSERPEDFGLDRRLAARAGDAVVPSTAAFDDPHKFAVEAQRPPVGIAVGSARLARLQFWPALKDLSMYSLRIREDGMREPHWHPITAEMGYVHEGSGHLLRPAHTRRHRLPSVGQRLLSRSPRRDVQRSHRRSARIPVHQGRSAHRDA
jgi:oxalate decarboxylase